MCYEGKGNREDYSSVVETKGKIYNKNCYMYCHSCNHYGLKGETHCTICGEFMPYKSKAIHI